MLKKSISILTIMVIVLIVGCSNKEITKHNYIYRGENEFWTAEFRVNGTETLTEKDNKISYKSNCSSELIVTYKKDLSELSSVKHLEISYKSSTGAGNIKEDYDNDSSARKTYAISSYSTNGAIENKDEEIEVTINIDEKIQTIELENE